MSTINVVDYNPDWARQFQALQTTLANALGDSTVVIEHVGSTAIPGLCAKPVIDIDIIVDGEHERTNAIERLAMIGYQHRGNLGIEGREAFASPHQSPAHHLYVCLQGSLGLRNHLAIRDFLRSNGDAVREYGKVKKQLANRFTNNIDAYVEGKTEFLLKVLGLCHFSAAEIHSIRQVNAQNKTTSSVREKNQR